MNALKLELKIGALRVSPIKLKLFREKTNR